MCLMVWKRTFYGNVVLSTTCQCRQLKLNLLSTQINIYCLMTNQTPALLVQRAPWTRAAVMLLQSLYFSRFLPNRPRPLSSFDTYARWQPLTQGARSRWSYGKIEDCEQSNNWEIRHHSLVCCCGFADILNVLGLGFQDLEGVFGLRFSKHPARSASLSHFKTNINTYLFKHKLRGLANVVYKISNHICSRCYRLNF